MSKTKLIFCTLFVLVVLVGLRAWATTYTVCSSGCDETTIQAVFDNNDLAPGDVVEVRADTAGGEKVFNESVLIESADSGTTSEYIIVRARDGDTIIVDPTEEITGWESAPEVGSGVYKRTSFTYDPYIVTVNNHRVAEINSTKMDDGTGETMLAYPADQEVESTCFSGTSVYFWDSCEILTGYKSGSTTFYFRERNGTSPSSYTVRTSQNVYAFRLYGTGGIELDGFKIRGAYYCVDVYNSSNVTIQNCTFLHGGRKVLIRGTSSDVVVTNNTFLSDYYVQTYNGDTVFAAHTTENYLNALRCYVYDLFKTTIGTSISDDMAVYFVDCGDNITITNNYIGYGLIGISGNSTSSPIDNVLVENNTITNMNSVGLTSDRGTTNYKIQRNTFNDCNIQLRAHYILNADLLRSVWVQCNLFKLPSSEGTQIYFWDSSSDDPGDDPSYYIYNNTLSGGAVGMSATSAVRTPGLDNTHILNNIISGADNNYSIVLLLADGGCAEYDYNCHNGTKPDGYDDALYGSNSLLETDPLFIDPSGTSTFQLQSTSPCIDAGDTISGVTLDLMGRHRPMGSAYDIGCYEFSLRARRRTQR